MMSAATALVLLLFTLFVQPAETACDSVVIEVFQGGISNYYQPVQSPDTVDKFYQYDGQDYNGDVPDEVQHTLVFIHQDTTTCDFGLVVVNGQKDVIQGGTMNMWIYPGDYSIPVVKDDPAGDSYTYDSLTDQTTVEWHWSSGASDFTDGMAHRLASFEDCVKLKIYTKQGIDNWYYVEGPKAPYTNHLLSIGVELRLCKIAVSGSKFCQSNKCAPKNYICRFLWWFLCIFLRNRLNNANENEGY
jgi:hypothetical protein